MFFKLLNILKFVEFLHEYKYISKIHFPIKLVSGLGSCISRDFTVLQTFWSSALKKNTHTWMKWDSNLTILVEVVLLCNIVWEQWAHCEDLPGFYSTLTFCLWQWVVRGFVWGTPKLPWLEFVFRVLHALFAWCIFENLSKEQTLICSAVFCICF